MDEKKGAMSIKMIISMVLIIVGFAMLFFLYTQFISFDGIDREVCHTSVILRATLPEVAKGYVPLKCPTQKICITGKFGKGECEEYKNTDYITIRVSNSDKGLNQVEKIYSDEVLGCWSMMGEGKVDVFPGFILEYLGVGKSEPSCVICSRIALDEKNLDKVPLDSMNIPNYMQTHRVPGKEESYAQYIAGEEYSATIKLQEGEEFNIYELDDEGKVKAGGGTTLGKSKPIGNDNKETAVLFMQITGPPSHIRGISNYLDASFGVGVASLVTAPIITAKIALSPVVWAVWAIGGVYQQGSIAYNRAVTASYCGDVPTSTSDSESGSKAGCSVVRTTNYDVEDILQYCEAIESIP